MQHRKNAAEKSVTPKIFNMNRMQHEATRKKIKHKKMQLKKSAPREKCKTKTVQHVKSATREN